MKNLKKILLLTVGVVLLVGCGANVDGQSAVDSAGTDATQRTTQAEMETPSNPVEVDERNIEPAETGQVELGGEQLEEISGVITEIGENWFVIQLFETIPAGSDEEIVFLSDETLRVYFSEQVEITTKHSDGLNILDSWASTVSDLTLDASIKLVEGYHEDGHFIAQSIVIWSWTFS